MLSPGTTLGPYAVTAKIGEGGMGEVYQATDTKLNRQVALKILPEAFAADPDRLARFQREAQVLASLNHPNIAAIYGPEEAEAQQTGSIAYLRQRLDSSGVSLPATPRVADGTPTRRSRAEIAPSRNELVAVSCDCLSSGC